MTAVTLGKSTYAPSPSIVQGVGVTTNDNWQPIASIPGASLPSGTGPYAFTVWGNISSVLAAVYTNRTMIQVGLGTQAGPFPDAIQSIAFSDGPLFQRQAVGFNFVRVHDTGSGLASDWDAANDLTLWARIFENFAGPANGGFAVSDVVMHAFDVSTLSVINGGWLGPQAYGGPPSGGNLHNFTELASWPSGLWSADKVWAIFYGFSYRPEGADTYSQLRLIYRPNQTQGNGPDPAWFGTGEVVIAEQGRNLFGTAYSVAAPEGRASCWWHTGGFYILGTSSGDADPDIRLTAHARSPLAESSRAERVEWFAVDVTDLPNWAGFAVDDATQIHNGGAVPAADVTYIPHTAVRSTFADVNYLWQVGAQRTLFSTDYFAPSSGLGEPYRMMTRLGQRYPGADYAAQYRSDEFHATVAGFLEPSLQPDPVQFQLFCWGIGVSEGKKDIAGVVRAAHWSWIGEAAEDPFEPQTPGAVALINPGYEAAALGSLTEVPVVPEDAVDTRVLDPKHSLLTDLGYELTWPAGTASRQLLTMRWQGITMDQRDALIAFFADPATRRFKWTRPFFGPTPLLAMGTIQTTDTGRGTFTARQDAVQLLYLSP